MGEGTADAYYLIVIFFTCAFVFCSLMSFVSFFKWLECASCCVCFFVYYFSLSLVPLTRSYCCLEIVVCLLCKTIHKVSIWSLFCVFPWKSECFNLNNSLGYLHTLYLIIRLLGWAYDFSLLICYPCSFYFHALTLLALWEYNLPPLDDTWKD